MIHKRWNWALCGSVILLAAACLFLAGCFQELSDEQKTYVPENGDIFILYRPETPNDAYETGLAKLCAGEYSASITSFQDALTEQEQALGKDHTDVAITMSALGVAYTWLVDYPKAEEQMRRALAITEKALGDASEKTAAAYGNLGIVCTRIPKLEEAEKLYQKAVEIGNELPEEFASDRICYQNSFATYLIMIGKHEEAQNILTTNLSILETGTKNEKILKATMECNLATYCLGQIGYKKALGYCKSASKAYEKIFGKYHPNTMTVAGGMALIYCVGMEYDKALELDHMVIDNLSKSVGESHHYLSDAYFNMGICYDGKNESEKSIKYFQMAIDNIKENGVRKETMASGYNSMAIVYEKEGRIDQAMDNVMKAYVICKKYEVDPLELNLYMRNIKRVYRMLGLDESNFDVWLAEKTPEYEALVETLVNP